MKANHFHFVGRFGFRTAGRDTKSTRRSMAALLRLTHRHVCPRRFLTISITHLSAAPKGHAWWLFAATSTVSAQSSKKTLNPYAW